MWLSGVGRAIGLLGVVPLVSAYDLVPTDATSVKSIAQKVIWDMMAFYPGNQTGGIPGLFGDPYYWWEAGAAFGSAINYWYYTGDEGYNNVTTEAMLFQVGDDENYMPANQSKSLGNDDQCFWGVTAMIAAETGFPDPPEDKPQWLALAQAVHNSQTLRWDNTTCGGGLRWQIYTFNDGYDYKNSVSNGCFFSQAARLARYTGNSSYALWAETAFDWVKAVGLMTDEYRFYDGYSVTDNCSVDGRTNLQWTYSTGFFLAGSAFMYNYTNGSDVWRERVEGILNATDSFFQPPGGPANTLYEPACEDAKTCNTDQQSFKAYLLRYMALTAKVAPFTHDKIMSYFYTTGINAALACSNGANSNTCGMNWRKNGEWDNMYGVGEQMAGLEAIQSNLLDSVAAPLTATTGGTSKGNVNAGLGGDSDPTAADKITVTTGGKIGAGFATGVIVLLTLGGSAWLMTGY